jgi:hypothetical protein
MRGHIQQIARALGVSEVPIFRGNVPNAAATPRGILYNPRFIRALERRVGRYGVLSVLAHELGHKVNRDDSFYSGLTHPWDKELRADYLSGYALARMGASLRQATAALRSLYQRYPAPSHPSTSMRIPAVESGWRQARAEASGTIEADATVAPPKAAPPALPDPPRPRMRVVSVPCTHAAHPYDVEVGVVPTPFGWQEVHEAVPCRHPAHRGHRQQVPAEPEEPSFDEPI